MTATRSSVLIMAGGTGGHIFPGLAVADALRAQGVEVNWLGAAGGMECERVPAAGGVAHASGDLGPLADAVVGAAGVVLEPTEGTVTIGETYDRQHALKVIEASLADYVEAYGD